MTYRRAREQAARFGSRLVLYFTLAAAAGAASALYVELRTTQQPPVHVSSLYDSKPIPLTGYRSY